MAHTIAYLPGDGVGPEVGAAAIAVLEAVSDRFGVDFLIQECPFGGAAIDSHGTPFPQHTQNAVARAHAVLLGAVGGPQWDDRPGDQRPEAGLLALRQTLGTWANLRVFKPHARAARRAPLKPEVLEGVDLIVVRELTGGLYFGRKARDGDRAVDECVYTVAEIERIVRAAAAIARGRSKRLASIDKANVLETSRLWRETAERVVAAEFPDIALTHALVDAAAMHLIQDPKRFDVIVTENMFGDILTDEAAVLTGSLGLIPSASIGDGAAGAVKGLYEPAHGSAPDIAGHGVANPVGMILSMALMLRHSFGHAEAAEAVERATNAALDTGVLTPDLGGDAATAAMTDAVIARLTAPATTP